MHPILLQIIEVCVIPLLGLATAYFIKWVNAKNQEIKNKTKNDEVDKYLDVLERTITSCVLATTQTYVEALKKENAFTAEAQKQAFATTYESIMTILSDEAKTVLSLAFTDLEGYITNRIEAEVQINK